MKRLVFLVFIHFVRMPLPVYSAQCLAAEEDLGCIVGAIVIALFSGREGKKRPQQGQKQPRPEDGQEKAPDYTAQFPRAYHRV